MDGLIAATAPPEHIAPLVDLEKMRRDGFLILPVHSLLPCAAHQRSPVPGSVRAIAAALPAWRALCLSVIIARGAAHREAVSLRSSPLPSRCQPAQRNIAPLSLSVLLHR